MDKYIFLQMSENEMRQLSDQIEAEARTSMISGMREATAWRRAYSLLMLPMMRIACTADLMRMAALMIMAGEGSIANMVLLEMLREQIKLRDRSLN